MMSKIIDELSAMTDYPNPQLVIDCIVRNKQEILVVLLDQLRKGVVNKYFTIVMNKSNVMVTIQLDKLMFAVILQFLSTASQRNIKLKTVVTMPEFKVKLTEFVIKFIATNKSAIYQWVIPRVKFG